MLSKFNSMTLKTVSNIATDFTTKIVGCQAVRGSEGANTTT